MHIHVPVQFESAVRASWGGAGTDLNFGYAGDYVIFDIDGPLALPWVADELRADVNTMLESGRRDLILDLADVPYADSSGLGVLVTIHNLIQGAGGKLVLLSVPGRVREMLKRLRLDQAFTFSDDTTLAFAQS